LNVRQRPRAAANAAIGRPVGEVNPALGFGRRLGRRRT
jgi:hypothetical protein